MEKSELLRRKQEELELKMKVGIGFKMMKGSRERA